MDNTNINPLEGAEDWAVVESTDPAIRLAYWDSEIVKRDQEYRRYLESQKAAQ